MLDNDQIQFTRNWWGRVVSDETKLVNWLLKLRNTEYGGYIDHLNFLRTNEAAVSDRSATILQNIAADEKKHFDLISNMLINEYKDKCGVLTIPGGREVSEHQSTYWDYVLTDTSRDLQAYAAANYFGEALAAARFEIIESMAITPEPVREIIAQILPEEIFHRETLMRLAESRAMRVAQSKHNYAFRAITK